MKRYLLLTVVTFLIVLLASQGYRLYQERKQEILTVNILETERSILHIPLYIALKENFFRDYNLKVNLKTDPQDADIVIGETVECLFTKPCDHRKDWLCFAGVTHRCGYFLLAPENILGFQWDDIKGKTVIAGPPENTGELVLESIARNKEIRPQHDFTILWNIPEHLKTGALTAGTATYILLKEPQASREESENRAKILLSLGQETGKILEVALLAHRDFASKHQPAMQSLSDSLYKAQIWMGYHNENEIARKTAAYFPDLDRSTLENSIKRHLNQETWQPSPVVDKDSYERLQTITDQGGELYCTVDFQDGIDNRFAKESVRSVEYIPEDKQEKKFPQDYLRDLLR